MMRKLALCTAAWLAIAASVAAAEPNGSVSGTVVDADNQGVADVDVTLAKTSSDNAFTSVTSALDGSFQLTGVPPGTYYLKAAKRKSRLGIGAVKENVKVEPGKKSDAGRIPLKAGIR